jgi:hypothetical protein
VPVERVESEVPEESDPAAVVLKTSTVRGTQMFNPGKLVLPVMVAFLVAGAAERYPGAVGVPSSAEGGQLARKMPPPDPKPKRESRTMPPSDPKPKRAASRTMPPSDPKPKRLASRTMPSSDPGPKNARQNTHLFV